MDESGAVSITKPVLVTFFLFTENFIFLARDRLEAAFILLGFLFTAVFLWNFSCFLTDFFRFACFFFFGIRAVYHCRRVTPKQLLAVLAFAKLA